VSVQDRIVAAPDGTEYVVEAWKLVNEAGNGLVFVIGLLAPWWTVSVKRFPVTFGSRPLLVERTLTADAARRRVDQLCRLIERGRVPARRS
jgi:hypothetical protein